MEERRRNLWVGLFVLVGLATLATLIVLFGQGPTALTTGGTYPLHIHFNEVADIRAGNLVTVKGITVGRVTSVDLLDRERYEAGVDVVVAIENAYWLPEGSVAQTTEVMLGQGRPPVEIIPGPDGAEPLVSGASLPGTILKAIDTILPQTVLRTFENSARNIGDAAEALTPVLEELEKILEIRSPAEVDRSAAVQGNLSSALARFDASLKHFNDVLGDPEVKSQLRATVENVHAMSEQGKNVAEDLEQAAADVREMMAEGRQLLTRVDQSVEKMDVRAENLAQAVTGSLDSMDRVLDHLNIIGQQVSSGQGNIGHLIMDNKLYESLVISSERLSQAVEEFRALIREWREGGKIRVAF
ncbi:MAG: MCE family protein [Phycisphaerae bacterium]|nr:MCE family protein [Phycisphaerae bacterium]